MDAISYGSLIVLTDGDDTSSKVTKNEALASIENKDIFFIAASEAVNTQVLGEFTAPSNIFTLNDSANLGTALTSAIDKVKTFEQGLYVLSYATPRRAGNHTLTLNAIDDYDCMTTISDDEAWQMSNSGELTSCLDSKSFSFNADGYTSVTPELEINGSAVTFTKQLEWNAKLRWSHANPDLVWSVITCEGSFDIQQAEDKRSISFERTSQSRAIASVNVYDKTTDTTDKQFLLMATKSSDITTGISLNNICNF